MGEILAVGITHYPPLAGRDETMSWILKRMLQNPHLQEKYRHSENWPAAMQQEWGNDEGVAAARAHRERLLQSLRKDARANRRVSSRLYRGVGRRSVREFSRGRHSSVLHLCARSLSSSALDPNNVWNEAAGQEVSLAGKCCRRKISRQRFDRSGIRHRLFLQAAASSARSRVRERGLVSRLRSQGISLSDNSVRDKLLRPHGDFAARRFADVRESARRRRNSIRPHRRRDDCSIWAPRPRAFSPRVRGESR